MSHENRIEYFKKVYTTGVYLQDTRNLALSSLTAQQSTIFSIRDHTILPYNFPNNVHVAVTFEFDLTYYEMERTAYNLLDWCGDLGGLLEALLVIIGAIYMFLHY